MCCGAAGGASRGEGGCAQRADDPTYGTATETDGDGPRQTDLRREARMPVQDTTPIPILKESV